MFTLYTSANAQPQYFRAVNCTNKFSGGPQSLLDNFHYQANESVDSSTGWLCPDVTTWDLANSYGDIHGYSAYWFGIFYCDDAANKLGYVDDNC